MTTNSKDFALETLGTKNWTGGGRDAIHVAVLPVIAAHSLRAGQHVGVMRKGETYYASILDVDRVGIIDPFLPEDVDEGESTWLLLYPRTITGLTHVWSHPAFPDGPIHPDQLDMEAKDEATAWVMQWMDGVEAFKNSEVNWGEYSWPELTFDDLMLAATDYVKKGEYISTGPRFDGVFVPAEFWDHYETITGTKTGNDDRGSFFSCSC